MKREKRPYITYLNDELYKVYEQNKDDREVLLTLLRELKYRKRKRAKDLRAEILTEMILESIDSNLKK